MTAVVAERDSSPRVRRSPTRVVLGEALCLTRTRIGILLTVVMVLTALFGPELAPHGIAAFSGLPFSPSAPGAPLGTDNLGHDVISQMLYGGRSILWEAFAATTLGVGAGIAWGTVAGYGSALLDDVLMRVADVVYAIPVIVLVLVVLSVTGPNAWVVVGLVAVGWLPQVARVARSVTKDVVKREFVETSLLIGVSRRRVVMREIAPNIANPLLVEYGLRLTWSIAVIAAISFLGFGAQSPATDWGLMINQNRQGLVTAPWGTLLPCLCIALFTVGTNLVADGLARAVAGIDRRG